MVINDAGKMIEKWYSELPNKFPDIAIDAYCIMPNHFHTIIINTGKNVMGDGGVGGVGGVGDDVGDDVVMVIWVMVW
ncbi:MAG: hypothetical protein LBG52_07860 [Candidatus Peribacteria bacterium]|jgi:hypothetical protein|nr:hypothetical protein [Candidatus Peribacteria bacterium]